MSLIKIVNAIIASPKLPAYPKNQLMAYETGLVKKLNQPQSIASVNLGIDSLSL